MQDNFSLTFTNLPKLFISAIVLVRSWVTSACSRTMHARARATAAPAVLYQAREAASGEESVRYMELEILVERVVILAVGPYHYIVEP